MSAAGLPRRLAVVVAALAVAGTWTVRIGSDGTATGAYRFVGLVVPATRTDPIALGEQVSGSLSAAGEWHDYTFAATPGQQVSVHGGTDCSQPTGLGWRLLDPAGTLVDFHAGCGTMGPDRLPVAGTYTVRILGDGPAPGSYAFTVRSP